MQSRRAVRLALVLAALVAALGIAGQASAASATGTLRLDPATTQVDNGATFKVNVISNSSIPLSGVGVSIKFDKNVLQITTITRASAWAGAQLFLAADAKAITTANQKGYLQDAAASFFPPGSVPAGDQQFITVEFKAIACGTVNLAVPVSKTGTDSGMLDGSASTYGATIPVTTTGATVTVCPGGGGASQAQGAGAAASTLPSGTGGPGASGSIDPNASASASQGPSDSSQPGAGVANGAGGASSGSASSSTAGSGPGGTTNEQSGWLTFAIAALAVAAAGLAALILILIVVAIAAAVAGGVVLIRVWRRYAEKDASLAEGAVASGTATPSLGTAEEAASDGGALVAGDALAGTSMA